jgi:GT2 family glycosyltransferase
VFGVVVNHYWRPINGLAVLESARFTVSLLARCPEVSEIVMVDAGPEPSPGIAGFCDEVGALYIHVDGGLSFADAFNTGALRTSSPWIGLICSDVYVQPETFASLAAFAERHRDEPIGCIVPYLSVGDVQTQTLGPFFPRRFDARIPIMSINLNVFPRQAWESIGGVPTGLSGNYNDIAMCIELALRGFGVYIAGQAYATHYGSLTIRGATETNSQVDRSFFSLLYREWLRDGAPFGVAADRLMDDRLLAWAYRALAWANRMGCRAGRPLRDPWFDAVFRWTPVRQRLKRQPWSD